MSRNYVCQVYGGQCECDQVPVELTSRIGRQCELCPFYTHVSLNGCTGEGISMQLPFMMQYNLLACTCPDALDNCNIVTGECSSCPPLNFGTSCESCILNTYRDENNNCLVIIQYHTI